MIAGLGNDILEVARMERELGRDSGLRDEVFTPAEIAYCEAMRRPAEHYAARWAAKEALFKALGVGYSGGVAWRDVEVRRDAAGRPELVLAGQTKHLVDDKHVTNIFVSLTHTRTLAAASVVLEAAR